MCSLRWPGHFNFFYSCAGSWRVLYWFGDPLSCQESGNDQWKVCIYYIFSLSPFGQEGNYSWNRIFLVSQLFECHLQVGNLYPGEGGEGGGREGALDFKWRGCSNGGKNQNQKKFLGLPTEPKNVMGPLLTSKAKKEALEVHSPLGWGLGMGWGTCPTLDRKALGAKLS